MHEFSDSSPPIVVTVLSDGLGDWELLRSHLAPLGLQVSGLDADSLDGSPPTPQSTGLYVFIMNTNDRKAVAKMNALRQANAQAGILALLLNGSPEARVIALQAGADDCLEYPVDPQLLRAVMASIARRMMW